MPVKPVVKILASDFSHLAFLYTWRESGVTRQHGFELQVHATKLRSPDQPYLENPDRAPRLLDGTYDFLSGLHHEPYYYRAKGDKRFVYLAQAQNDWDDRFVVSDSIRSVRDLEGKTVIAAAPAPCVLGNLRHSIEAAGADLSRINFVTDTQRPGDRASRTLDAVLSNEAAGAGVDPPFDLRAEKLGLHVLELPAIPVIHNCTICSNIEWVRENEETTLAFLRSMVDAIHFFKTEPSRVCEILEAHVAPVLGIKSHEEIEHLQSVWARLLSAKPFPHPLAVWNVYNLDVAHDANINFIGPFDLWDTHYLRAIDDSQYIDELYGSAHEAVNPPVNPAI
ncbi:MAG TPA: ABC transporter substrate-binding protein [Chloroflexota bacterium]|nr:ABC transporter substrate-binding protein [Chloroflexota bacterium]